MKNKFLEEELSQTGVELQSILQKQIVFIEKLDEKKKIYNISKQNYKYLRDQYIQSMKLKLKKKYFNLIFF